MDIQHRLEGMGYKVVGWVAAGDQVIPEIEHARPDLVLMDIRLQGAMDGIHAAQAIRQNYLLPVVYLTAFADDDILQRAKDTGPFGFVLKPCNDPELHTAIELALYKCQVDRSLRENEQWLATTLRSMSDGVIATDADGRVKLMNAVAEKLTGWPLSEAQGEDVNRIVKLADPLHRTIRIEAGNEALLKKDREPSANPQTLISKTDHEFPVSVSMAPIYDARGQVTGVVLIVRDRTGRARAKATIEEERNLLRTLIDAFPDSIYVKDASSRFIIGNQALAARMGVKHPGELIGKTDFDYYPKKYAEAFRADEQRVIATNRPLINREEQSVDPAGKSRWLLTTKVPLCNREGQVTGVVGTGRDITEIKQQQVERERIEVRMRELQKLESIGVLAAGIAHDFNNILMGIQGSVEVAQMKLSLSQPLGDCHKDILTFCQRASRLTQQLLAYAGKACYRLEPINLSELIREMTPPIQSMIGKQADLRLQLDDHLPLVHGDAAQIRQVIMNLIINASEALGDKPGFIRVETGKRNVDSRYVVSAYCQAPLPEGCYVYVKVADSGGGMNADTQARIFEPFFTTKFMGRGLGLAVILGIVRNHNGDIHVASEKGKGTWVEFLLPCQND